MGRLSLTIYIYIYIYSKNVQGIAACKYMQYAQIGDAERGQSPLRAIHAVSETTPLVLAYIMAWNAIHVIAIAPVFAPRRLTLFRHICRPGCLKGISRLRELSDRKNNSKVENTRFSNNHDIIIKS